MDRRPVIHDWYCRMMLEVALTELWLAKGHRAQSCIDRALAAMEGFEVPLAAWRVHDVLGEAK